MTLRFLRVPGITHGVDEMAQRGGLLPPTGLVSAKNAVPVGAGRLGLRPNLIVGPTLTDASAVIAAAGLGAKAIFVGWDTSNNKYLVYEWDWSTSPLTGKGFSDSGAPAGKRYSEGITSVLGMSLAHFDEAIFMCCTAGTKALAFYYVGATNPEIVPALDLSAGTDAHATPRGLSVYRNHLFMSGYESEDYPSEVHALRWSKPGVARTASDWVDTDYDYVGVEGVPIYSHHPIGDSLLVVLKRDSIHALYGYKSTNFSLREIRGDLGSAGYRAAVEYLNAVWFWTSEGKPAVLAAGEVRELDRPIRDTLLEYDFTQPDRLWVAPWPQYQCVVFGAPAATIEGVQEPLVWDVQDNRWLQKLDFPGADLSTLRKIWSAVAIDRYPSGALPGPAAPPSNLDSEQADHDSYRSTWTNGDNSPGVTTVLEIKEDAPTAGSYVDDGTVPVYDPSWFEHTGLTEKETHTVRARHERNGQATPVGQRPTKQSKTTCASAPVWIANEQEDLLGNWEMEVRLTARSGRSGAASTITLQRKVMGESEYSTVQTWTGREDEASPTELVYNDEVPCWPLKSIFYRTKVTDEASTWPDSDYEYAATVTNCSE